MSDELKKLMEQAAARLSGHPVKVRWRRPSRTDARAIAFKSGDRAIIDLHPGEWWDSERLLFTLLHEIAHVKELYPEWTNLPDYPSGSIQVSARARSLPGVVQIEDSADEQAKRWVNYAKSNYVRYWQTGDDICSAALRALADYEV